MSPYLIVSFLKRNHPSVFQKSDWPLHVTIVRPFSSSKAPEEIIKSLTTLCAKTSQLKTIGKSREMFGPENDIHVTELEKTPELQALHEKAIKAIEPIEFTSFEYPNFRPHITDQGNGSFVVDQEVILTSLSLVKISGHEREVLHTATLRDKLIWFRRKSHGWGWVPVTWQGWTITLGWAAFLFLGTALFKNRMIFLVYAILLVAVLIKLCYTYGESPRWQWGEGHNEHTPLNKK